MKKIYIFLLLFICYPLNVYSKTIPDPLYIDSEVKDYEQTEQKEKPNDPRTIEEKVRAKLHLPPTKKLYYHNIDKSNIPITMDDYYKLAIEKKRKDFVIPEPVFEEEKGIIMPDSKYRVVRYNSPPGQRNIDLSKIIQQKTVNSAGILSPDKTKMVYTKASFYPEFYQTASSVFYIPVNDKYKDAYDALYMTNVIEGNPTPILTSGIDNIQQNRFISLFPIDFSKDSNKIAIKEKIGSNLEETWQTNIIVYNFETKSYKRLNAIREAIIYWWKENKQIDLKEYMWDIFPIGWDKNNPDRIIVYAYAFTENKPLFLGTWSIDSNETKSSLISIDSTDVQIDLNGFGLKEIKFEN